MFGGGDFEDSGRNCSGSRCFFPLYEPCFFFCKLLESCYVSFVVQLIEMCRRQNEWPVSLGPNHVKRGSLAYHTSPLWGRSLAT